MWAVVCVSACDLAVLDVRLFDGFGKAARFMRKNAETVYKELLQLVRDTENVSLHCDNGHAELITNGSLQCFWDMISVVDNCD